MGIPWRYGVVAQIGLAVVAAWPSFASAFDDALVWNGRTPESCITTTPLCSKTYKDDAMRGLGIVPRRTYFLDYDGSPVCGKIRDALNAAIAAGKASEKAVLLPLPPDQVPTEIPEKGRLMALGPREYWQGMYEAKNPILADEMFLAWSYLDGRPNDLPARGVQVIGETRWDYARARWLIVPLGDGRRYLVTRDVYPDVDVWDVPEAELERHDWSRWENYKPYKTIQVNPWKNEYPTSASINPVTRFRQLYPQGVGIALEHPPQSYPNLPKDLEDPSSGAFWGGGGGRSLASVNFARIDGRTYLLLLGNFTDNLVVADVERPPGDDVCYLRSKLRK
jgi:hypothetical protein